MLLMGWLLLLVLFIELVFCVGSGLFVILRNVLFLRWLFLFLNRRNGVFCRV